VTVFLVQPANRVRGSQQITQDKEHSWLPAHLIRYCESNSGSAQPELLISAALHLMSHYSANSGEAGACVKLAAVIERHLKALAAMPDLAPVLRDLRATGGTMGRDGRARNAASGRSEPDQAIDHARACIESGQNRLGVLSDFVQGAGRLSFGRRPDGRWSSY
jgi:hypothetical protein